METKFNLGTGLHEKVPATMYHALPFASQSNLKLLAEGYTPAHVKVQMDGETPQTPALILGSAVHALVLEPAWAATHVLRGPTKTRAAKAWTEAVEAGDPDAIWLTEDEFSQAQCIAEAVRRNKSARLLLEQPDLQTELTGIWRTVGVSEEAQKPLEEQEYGETPFPCLCKFRTDGWSERCSTILDLKTTTDASKVAFQKSVLNFGYHYQAGWYKEGMRRVGKPVEHFVVIAVEKDPPYGVAVYRIDDAVAAYGLERLWGPLEAFARCAWTNDWPGYPDEVTDIALPPWAMGEVTPLE